MTDAEPAARTNTRRTRDVVVVEINAPDLDAALGAIAARDGAAAIEAAGIRLRGVVLDLTAVSFMNSGGLAACIDVARQAGKAGVRCVAAGLGDELERLIEVMKLGSLIEVGGTVDDAVRSLA